MKVMAFRPDRPEDFLREVLTVQASLVPRRHGYAYSCAQEFVLKHGVWYRPTAIPLLTLKGAPKQCYGNAIVLCLKYGWKYVEGFALPPFGIPVQHAWNLDEQGVVWDTTWMNTGLAYLGVEFSLGRADDASWNGDASVLDDSNRGFPIFKEPWKGEDHSIKWPESYGLTINKKALSGEITVEEALRAIWRVRDATGS